MSHLTRRSFLEHTLAAASAGLAATTFARGDDVPQADDKAKKTAANDRIRLAVIGLHGRGTDAHVDAFSNDDTVEIVGLCDVDTAQFAKAQTELQERGRREAKTYQDLRQLFDDKDVHAVSIATPNHWHALAGVWAMQAGKDVYVEKPVSHEVTEGRRLEEARLKYNRVCQAGTQSRSTRATQEAIKYIEEGHIGKVILSRALCYKRRKTIGHFEDSQGPETLNYDIWQGPAQVQPFNKNRFLYEWHWNWAYGNGDIGNQGVHQMDIARWALGKKLPTSVVSLGGRFGYKDDGNTPNTMLTLMDFGDSKLLFEVRGLETGPVPGVGVDVGNIMYGTEGFVAMTADYGKAAAFDNKGKMVKQFKGSGSHFSNFTNAIKTRQQSDLNCPIIEGHYSAALCHLANISYRMGEPIPLGVRGAAASTDVDLAEAFGRFQEHLGHQLDELKKASKGLQASGVEYTMGPKLEFNPITETFGSNAAANKFLTRDYRAPFVMPDKV